MEQKTTADNISRIHCCGAFHIDVVDSIKPEDHVQATDITILVTLARIMKAFTCEIYSFRES